LIPLHEQKLHVVPQRRLDVDVAEHRIDHVLETAQVFLAIPPVAQRALFLGLSKPETVAEKDQSHLRRDLRAHRAAHDIAAS
jgi:hypothetical protein